MVFLLPTFTAGLVLSLSLIMAIGPQNAHVLRMGLTRQHVGLTVLVCMLSDIVLISLGVFGLARLGALSDRLQGALVGAGILFLSVYGWTAFRRFLCPPEMAVANQIGVTTGPSDDLQPPILPMSRRQAVMSALALSWLNPHAWLDTAVLIGTASLAYGPAGKVFGFGAAAGSVIWFALLGVAAFWLGRRLDSLIIWRVLDGLVAMMMWGTALWLFLGLL